MEVRYWGHLCPICPNWHELRHKDIWFSKILYTSFTLPFMVYSDAKCRSEGWTIGLMGLETFLLTNGITTITKSAVQRYRPFTYNPDVPLAEKQSKRSTLSFFSGHTSVTTSLSFFTAKVLTDLRPGSKNNWIIWTLGASTPALIGYLRYEAGKHFLTVFLRHKRPSPSSSAKLQFRRR